MPVEVEILKLRRFLEELDFKIARCNGTAASVMRLTVMKSDCWKAIAELTVIKLNQ